MMLARFTHLKRNKRFDNFIMLVWGQGCQTGKNAPILLAMFSKCLSCKYNSNHNSLPYVECFFGMVMQ